MKNILFISHDSNRAGAQILLLDAMKYLKNKGHNIHLLTLINYGDVFEGYEEEFNLVQLPTFESTSGFKGIFLRKSKEQAQQEFILQNFQDKDIDLIYANTIAVSYIAPKIKKWLATPLISHIHEMEYSINMYSNVDDSNRLFEDSDRIIACSKAVKDNLLDKNPKLDSKIEVIYSFVDNETVLEIHENKDKLETREIFQLPKDKILIGGCGNAEWRKGVDLFLQVVQKFAIGDYKGKVHFVWIGIQEKGDFYQQIRFDLKRMGIEESISLLPPTQRAKEVINSLDIFLLSSREDPFPLVMLEAALCEVPMVGFENAGGCCEFVSLGNGVVSSYANIDKMAEKLESLIDDKSLRSKMGALGQKSVIENYSYEISMKSIEELLLSF